MTIPANSAQCADQVILLGAFPIGRRTFETSICVHRHPFGPRTTATATTLAALRGARDVHTRCQRSLLREAYAYTNGTTQMNTCSTSTTVGTWASGHLDTLRPPTASWSTARRDTWNSWAASSTFDKTISKFVPPFPVVTDRFVSLAAQTHADRTYRLVRRRTSWSGTWTSWAASSTLVKIIKKAGSFSVITDHNLCWHTG